MNQSIKTKLAGTVKKIKLENIPNIGHLANIVLKKNKQYFEIKLWRELAIAFEQQVKKDETVIIFVRATPQNNRFDFVGEGFIKDKK